MLAELVGAGASVSSWVMRTHSDLASVFKQIDSERNRSVDRLLDYLRHPSISAHNIGIQNVAQLLVAMLTAMGLETRTLATAGHPMVVARWAGAPGRPGATA